MSKRISVCDTFSIEIDERRRQKSAIPFISFVRGRSNGHLYVTMYYWKGSSVESQRFEIHHKDSKRLQQWMKKSEQACEKGDKMQQLTVEQIQEIFSYIDNLIVQGKTQDEAVEHARQQFGLMPVDIYNLLSARNAATQVA
jgi:hypothetical protein